jgi:hypothetical protein
MDQLGKHFKNNMSYCTPCPPCDTEFPLLCEPLELTTQAKRLVVEDTAACQKTLQTPTSSQQILKSIGGNLSWTNGGNNSLVTKDSSGVVDMKDGSVGQPINLVNLVQDTTSIVAKMIVMMTDGTIKAWEPSVTADQFIAYWDGSDWKVNNLNTLLPTGQGLFIRNTSGSLAVVPNGVSGSSLQMVGSSPQFVAASQSQFPGGHLYGLTLSNSVTSLNNDIAVSTGECRAASNTSDILVTSTIVKQLNNLYATGSNAGGIVDSATKQASSSYHAFVISNGTTVDLCFSASIIPTGQPNYPAGFTQYRRIGAVTTDSSNNIRQFIQFGDRFLYTGKPVADANGISVAVGGTLITLSVPANIKVIPIVNCFNVTGGIYITFYDADSTWPPTLIPAVNNTGTNILLQGNNGYSGYSPLNGIMTNTTRQIGVDVNAAQTNTFFADTYGWFDQRGRLQP